MKALVLFAIGKLYIKVISSCIQHPVKETKNINATDCLNVPHETRTGKGVLDTALKNYKATSVQENLNATKLTLSGLAKYKPVV